ncbi:MarR family winged helix-turn-helix transcriptional regulator [[Mycobacterium] vasticus]|uniref:MarR family winged helix-turn-helix transcriptional regulator n=1 Tax=[Mycobacterium] vasticus TaxID=2875777 RepID=A0ABU5Z1C4_9MYCO|nr:MarR family winged helix-turn-helix transcriptional regulator [Mycolicibacter sp. MYC017]MEB3070710.1 MarR family winged helix-turn-helix transcriptional regulator [Mycolicibacter sp. MYC017]
MSRTAASETPQPPRHPGVDYRSIEEFVTESFQRHAIDFGEWIAETSRQRANARGYDALRRAHNRVFVHLSLDGSRVVDIAEAEGVSKTAIGQLVTELEELGFVERRADPDDGRAKKVFYTRKGIEMLETARSIAQGIDADLAGILGKRKFDQLANLLAEAFRAKDRLDRQGSSHPK